MFLNVNFFLKSMILNEKNFVKSMILKKNFFVLSDFETTFFTTRQIPEQLFYKASDFELKILQFGRFGISFINNMSDFESTSFAVCQIFMRSL